jgi:adenylate kinase
VVAQPDRKPLYLILLGAPGAGKGTQANLLSAHLNLPRISSGDLFREHINAETPLGREAKSYIDRGELVPDSLTVEMMRERLQHEDCQSGAVMDGFPRTIPQAEAFDEALAATCKTVRAVIDLQVDHEVLLERLSGRWMCRQCGASYHTSFHPPAVKGRCDECGGELYQRDDDRSETVEHRLEVYFRQTAPLQELYRRRGRLVEIDGEQPIEQVREAVTRAIGLNEAAEL